MKYKFTIIIILLNVILFYLLQKQGLSFRNYVNFGGLLVVQGELIDIKTLVTYGFVHKSWAHLAYNMIFGGALMLYLERIVGSKRLAVTYLLSIIIAGVALVMSYQNQTALPVGASGGIYGIMGLAIVVFIKEGTKIHLISAGVLFILTLSSLSIGHSYGALCGILLGFLFIKIDEDIEERKRREEIWSYF
jgi:membrane associated rhomboid family serine protease